ncbi:MAG: hypothetical protein LW688_04270 [Cryomorphaceae bacterium]|nr:hypothetical protein [Cryomorphaceae bacterium]
MNALKKILPFVLVIGAILGIIYLLWWGLSSLSTLIPWYISLSLFLIGALMFTVGKFFLKKENILKSTDSHVILSTPIQADLAVIVGAIVMLVGAITSKFFFDISSKTGFEGFFMLAISILVLLIAVTSIVMNLVRLRHSLNDRIEISAEQFRVDSGMSGASETYNRNDIHELELIKEFSDQSSNTQQLLSDNGSYSSDDFKYILRVKLKPSGEQQEISVFNLDTSDINVDVSLFVEALELMSYSIVRRSKLDRSNELWEGHNFEDAPIAKE